MRQIVGIARELNQIGWGNQGSITGMVENISIDKIWPNPMRVIEHSPDEIEDMKESLQAEGQKDPIVVAYAKAPDDLDGYEECVLLIVDGDLRYRGRLKQGKDTIQAIVQPFTSMTQIILDNAIRTLHRRIPTPMEMGRFIIRLRLAYDSESDRNPNVPRFPTQEELGRMLGKSQSSVSQWLQLTEQPEPIVNLLDAGTITQAQAVELMRIDDDATRIQQAVKVAEQNQQTVTPVTRDRVREEVTAQKRPIAFEAEPLPYSELWTPRITLDTPTPMALAYTARDLGYMLGGLLNRQKSPHPALKKLECALRDPAIQSFLQTVLHE